MRSIGTSLLFFSVLTFAAAAPLEARPSKRAAQRVAVGTFEGEGGAELQAVVIAALGKLSGAQIVSSDAWQAEAGRIGADLGSAEGVTRTAGELEVAAIVTGTFSPAGKSWQAVVQVLAGDGGSVAGSYKTKQRTKAKALADVKKRFAKKLGGAIRAQKAPEPTPPPTAEPAPVAEAPAPAPEPTPAPSAPKKRVVVLEFEGDRAGELRDFLEKELSASGEVETVSKADLQRISKEQSLDIDDEEDRAKAAARLNLSAFVAGEVERGDREMSISYEVFAGVDGESVGKGQSSSNRVSSLARVLRRDLSPLLERARAPGQAKASEPVERSESTVAEAPRETSTTRAETEREAPSEPRSGLRSASPLELAVGFQWGLRNFDYKDDLFGALRAYEHPGVTALSARLLWYPAAHFTSGFASNLGVDVLFDLGLGLGTETEDGVTQFGTSAMSLAASLRWRLPLGVHELGVFAGLALDQFSLDGAETFFPNVSYMALRPGVAGRFWLGDLISLSPHFAWRVVLDAGDVAGADWFPNASVGGLDAGLSVGIAIVGPLEAQLAATYRRYFYSMNPEVGDLNVAGGALDQRITGTFYLAFHLD